MDTRGGKNKPLEPAIESNNEMLIKDVKSKETVQIQSTMTSNIFSYLNVGHVLVSQSEMLSDFEVESIKY